MIEKYGYKIGNYLWKKGYIDNEDDADYIRYAFVALSSDILNTVGILIIALCSHKLPEMLIYLIGFHLLRSNVGGYHADSFAKCVVMTMVDFIIALWYSTFHLTWLTAGLYAASMILFFRYKPYFTEDQWQFSKIEEKHKRSKIISILLLIAGLIFHILGYVPYYHILGALMMEVSLSMIYGRYQHERS